MMNPLKLLLRKLIPEDMHRGCGYGPFSSGPQDPLIEACNMHDDDYAERMTSVRADRRFLAHCLNITSAVAEVSLNRGLILLSRVLIYFLFVRTIGVVLRWRLD